MTLKCTIRAYRLDLEPERPGLRTIKIEEALIPPEVIHIGYNGLGLYAWVRGFAYEESTTIHLAYCSAGGVAPTPDQADHIGTVFARDERGFEGQGSEILHFFQYKAHVRP